MWECLNEKNEIGMSKVAEPSLEIVLVADERLPQHTVGELVTQERGGLQRGVRVTPWSFECAWGKHNISLLG